MKNIYICIISTSNYNEYLPYFFSTLKFLKFNTLNIHPIVISDKKYLDYKYYPIAHLPYPFVSYLKTLIVQNALEFFNCDKNDYMMCVDADTMIRKLDNYDFLEKYILNNKMIFSISPWSYFDFAHENSMCRFRYPEVYIDNIQQEDFLQMSFFSGKIDSFYNFNKLFFDLCQEFTKDWEHKRIPPMIDQSIVSKIVHDNKYKYLKDYFLVDDYNDYKLEEVDNIPEYEFYCGNAFNLKDHKNVFLIQKFNQRVKKPIRYSIND